MALPAVVALLINPATAIPTAVIGIGCIVYKIIETKNKANELNHDLNKSRLEINERICKDNMNLRKKFLFFCIGLSVLLLIFGIICLLIKKL